MTALEKASKENAILAIASVKKILDWQKDLIYQLDEMVDSFLDFSDTVPKTFQDYQFARHTIWKIMDNQKHFRRLFITGAEPIALDIFWRRLLPYITGDAPESPSIYNYAVIRLSIGMWEIARDVAVEHRSNMDQLMDRMVAIMRNVREVQ